MGFGVVQAADGKKFKTRSGDTVKLVLYNYNLFISTYIIYSMKC